MQDGKALQAGTSHFLGQNFAKSFDVQFTNKEGKQEYVWATSWGVSTRLMGALIMAHGDDNGLVLPPALAPIQVVMVPIYRGEEERNAVLEKMADVKKALEALGHSVKIDDRDTLRPGFKFAEWELKGVPVRLAMGARDLQAGSVEVARRDTLTKETMPLEGIAEHIHTLLDDIQQNIYDKALAFRDANVEKCDSYNQMLAGSITWDLPNGDTMTVDKETTVNWLSQDEDGSYYRDEDLWEEKIEFWVDELARNVNTVGRDWSFDATGVGEITVSGGDYGYSVNKIDEREEVWDILWDGETEEREPYFYTTQYNEGSGIGDTYIEANLSQQHVWIYIDGVMVCDTPCVSGNVNNGHGTPTGVYQILYKDTDTDLKGQQLANGQYSYISHVDYWMPFYGGCGFHDASWRSSFGGNIYKYDGSHGCINLPPSIAPKFYSYVRTGMPVVVFY